MPVRWRARFLFEEFIAREHDRKAAALAAQTLDAAADAGCTAIATRKPGAMKSPRKVLRLIPAASLSLSTPAVAAWPAALA